MTDNKTVVLCILDGWGLADPTEGNAIAQALTPTLDRLMARCPHATLKTSGEDVGLPPGQMGNSEVGHTNIGAGRVVWMDLPKIDRAIEDGQFDSRPALASFIDTLKASGGRAHVLGLMSPGGVHAHQRHIAAAAAALATAGVPVRLHLFTDGRDTPPVSAADYLAQFETQIDGLPDVEIATVSGRFFALDRDHRWERVVRAYRAIVDGASAASDAADAPVRRAATPAEAIAAAYAADKTDEFIPPTVIGAYAGVAPGDGLFMTNFRADRARQLLQALLAPTFDAFERGPQPAWAAALGMVAYSDALNEVMAAVFEPEPIVDGLGSWVSRQGLTQFRLAETEKYPHVTFFLNGGVEAPTPGETRRMPKSPRVKTYDLAPEMASEEVTAALVEAIRSRDYDLVVCNYANPDMVGHTGDLFATMRAVEAVDRGLAQAVAAVEETGAVMLIISDHGNAEQMIDPDSGGPHTAHTTNPVPIILVGGGSAGLATGGRLGDVAPTVLALMGVPQPPAMTGRSLLTAARA